MKEHEDDERLLERARAGDRDATEELLTRHQAEVYRFGMKMCRDPEDAKDVLQDTMLSVARGVRDFRGASSLSTWLFTIARSFCIKKRRKSKFAPREERSLDEPHSSAEVLIDPSKTPEEAVAGREVEHALEQAIRSLDPMYREVLLLRDVEGLTAPEVAQVLGLSVQAVKTRLHRARLSVRAEIAPMLGIPTEETPANETCPDVLSLFSRHLEDEISPEICKTMEQHLEGCSRCRGACDSLKRTLALCRTTAPAVEVPASVQASVKIALRNFLTETT